MLITHGTLVTLGEPNQLIADGALLIRGDRIGDVGPARELEARYHDEERLDAQGKLVMPGNVCAHTHFYGAFARGMALPPGPPPKNFPEILQKLWWRIDRALTLEDSKYSALVCLVDAIRHGTTTLIDHHASPNAIDGSLDAIAEAVEQSGLRACLCYEVTDRNGEEGARAGIRENVRFLKRIEGNKGTEGNGGGLVRATFGLHASFTVSDETLERCLSELEGMEAGFHVHVAEDLADEDDAVQKYGVRVGERLEARGILGARTIAAHCVHVDVGEIDLFKRTETKVSHQPRSNMNNAVGRAPVEEMIRAGVNVGLGNDGFSMNMMQEMKAAYLLHKLALADPRVMPGDLVLNMAFARNAQIMEAVFSPFCGDFPVVGQLSVGGAADIVLLDYLPPTPLSSGNFPWHLIFGIDAQHVHATMVAGRWLMRNRQLLTVDEERIHARAKELSSALWQRMQNILFQEH